MFKNNKSGWKTGLTSKYIPSFDHYSKTSHNVFYRFGQCYLAETSVECTVPPTCGRWELQLVPLWWRWGCSSTETSWPLGPSQSWAHPEKMNKINLCKTGRCSYTIKSFNVYSSLQECYSLDHQEQWIYLKPGQDQDQCILHFIESSVNTHGQVSA